MSDHDCELRQARNEGFTKGMKAGFEDGYKEALLSLSVQGKLDEEAVDEEIDYLQSRLEGWERDEYRTTN